MGRIKAFLLGGLIGAGAALVLAPKTGEEMRALIAEKANAFAGEAADFGAGLPDSATDLIKNATGAAGGIVNDATAKVKGVAGGANETDPDELRAKIEAARQRIAAQVMENAEKAQEAAEEVEDAVVEATEQVTDAVEEAAEEIADKAEEAKHAAK